MYAVAAKAVFLLLDQLYTFQYWGFYLIAKEKWTKFALKLKSYGFGLEDTNSSFARVLTCSWVQISRYCFSHSGFSQQSIQWWWCQNRLHRFKEKERKGKKTLFCLCTICVGCAGWSQNNKTAVGKRQQHLSRKAVICFPQLFWCFFSPGHLSTC